MNAPQPTSLAAGNIKHHLSVRQVNIWRDPDAAAFVRSVVGGNETVPTVVIDGRALVNPAPRQVIAAVRPG